MTIRYVSMKIRYVRWHVGDDIGTIAIGGGDYDFPSHNMLADINRLGTVNHMSA